MPESQHHLLATGPKTRHVRALSFPSELSGPVWAGKCEANHEWEIDYIQIDYIQMTSQKTASGHQKTERAKSVSADRRQKSVDRKGQAASQACTENRVRGTWCLLDMASPKKPSPYDIKCSLNTGRP